jgi:16S rRNA (guanine966-N2)-methyltransferase
MTLRILGGQFKGRLIKTPKGVSTRPTSSLLRKAVFDICQNLIEDCRFLDLFAGSGAMGIEAISRGASHATFVDNDKNAHSCILANIELLKIAPHCTALKGDALAMLQKLERDKRTFDLVYIDPPYGAGRKGSDLPLTLEILKHLSNSSLLSEEASVFVEEAVSKDPAPLFESQTLQHINSRSFGKSLLHQYRKFL